MPEEVAPPTGRMEPIATLPVFLKLKRRRAVLAGGTPPAVWKAELLAAAGAAVIVYAAEPCAEMGDLIADSASGAITLVPRAWTAADLEGAAVALAAIEDDEEAGAFRDAARKAGVPVNVIDKPAFCDFQFGTLVSRSPLLVAISTDGAAPVFGQAIRARIEALLPQSLRRWAEAARAWRPAVQDRKLDFRARRRFWEVFADRALRDAATGPQPADFEACESAALGSTTAAPPVIALVCAGPGDPDLVTLYAIRALQSADVVFFGPEVSALVVGYARREAQKIAVQALSGSGMPAEILAHLQPGRRLAWLDAGNPALCLRWTSRAEDLRAANSTIEPVAGLGICGECLPGCPAWRGPL